MSTRDEELLNQRQVWFYAELNDKSCIEIQKDMMYLCHQNPDEPIHFIIGSEGGDVDYLLGIHDLMQSLPCPVYTYCFGRACSAGAVLFASGAKGHRYTTPNSQFMIHFTQTGFQGSNVDMNIYQKWANSLDETLLKLMMKYTGQSAKKLKKDMSREFNLSGTQAVEYGLADQLIPFVR